VNRLAQRTLGYVVSQGVFWVASVSLVEHMYTLRSKGKPILEDSDRLWDKEKPIPGNAKRLPGNTDRLSRKIEPETGRTESELGKTEPSSGKVELGLSYGCGLWEEFEPISGEEDNEESVTMKREFRNVGSSVDEKNGANEGV
jgi:hypothetical protein